MSTPTYLDGILAAHRARAAADQRDLDVLVEEAAACRAPRPFLGGLLAAGPRLAVIAEIKRRSPSKGPLDLDLDPAELADQYAGGGATCLSVLTDADYFGGSPEDLAAAHSACALPVLRKDFTVGLADVADARLMVADAVLLIVAALSDDELESCMALAARLELTALVEVHDEAELDRALQGGAVVVGVNQRDLVTFDVDHERALRMIGAIPEGVVAVAESGVRGREDARRLAEAGYQAVLVGETLVRSADPRGAVDSLVGHPVGRRTVMRASGDGG